MWLLDPVRDSQFQLDLVQEMVRPGISWDLDNVTFSSHFSPQIERTYANWHHVQILIQSSLGVKLLGELLSAYPCKPMAK